MAINGSIEKRLASAMDGRKNHFKKPALKLYRSGFRFRLSVLHLRDIVAGQANIFKRAVI